MRASTWRQHIKKIWIHLQSALEESWYQLLSFVGGICVRLLQLSFLREGGGSRFNWPWLKSVVTHLLIVCSPYFTNTSGICQRSTRSSSKYQFHQCSGTPTGDRAGTFLILKAWFYRSEMLGNDTQSCRNIQEDGSLCTNVSLFPCGR